MTPERWDWAPPLGPARLCAELAETGIAWIRAPEIAEAAPREPWACAERLLGERAVLLERQPIRAVPGGRSFSSGRMAAPFHTDSQMLLGAPPHVQVMACHSAAEAGGESLYLDTWALLSRIEQQDPELLARLFTTVRHFPFVFGDVFGATVSLRGGSLVFTHSARPLPGDEIAARLAPWLEAEPPIEIRAAAGDLVLIHNHRLLHGRRAFAGGTRSFTRLLLWRTRAWAAPARWVAQAERAAASLRDRLREATPAVREAYGVGGGAEDERRARHLGVVLELLRGVPPGVLSAREGVAEPEIYRWRDAVLRGAGSGLAEDAIRPRPADAGPEEWLGRLR
jgi:gamma-butyrobetaine dioxygenase